MQESRPGLKLPQAVLAVAETGVAETGSSFSLLEGPESEPAGVLLLYSAPSYGYSARMAADVLKPEGMEGKAVGGGGTVNAELPISNMKHTNAQAPLMHAYKQCRPAQRVTQILLAVAITLDSLFQNLNPTPPCQTQRPGKHSITHP